MRSILSSVSFTLSFMFSVFAIVSSSCVIQCGLGDGPQLPRQMIPPPNTLKQPHSGSVLCWKCTIYLIVK